MIDACTFSNNGFLEPSSELRFSMFEVQKEQLICSTSAVVVVVVLFESLELIMSKCVYSYLKGSGNFVLDPLKKILDLAHAAIIIINL